MRLVVMLSALLAFGCVAADAATNPAVKLAGDGKSLPVVVLASPSAPLKYSEAAIADLRRVLERMTGVKPGDAAAAGAPGIYVGTLEAFAGWQAEIPDSLDAQEFVILTTPGDQVLLIGGGDWGVSHAIYEMLQGLGCRWYYPGSTWEIVPTQPSPTVSGGVRGRPDFFLQRRIWAGHGLHSPVIRQDHTDWMRRNRMGAPLGMHTSHSWVGLDPAKEFETNPEYFALVGGERRASKPCYSHPDVIARATAHALEHFRRNSQADMISLSPPDGLGFCECELCQKVAGVVEVYPLHGTTFGRTADGREVSLASETLFRMANEVAKALAKEFPGKYAGILAYSGYAHPPTFRLEPNIYVEITRGFRRTPLTQGEQIAQYAARASLLGIYEYYDVMQWSWDRPGAARAADLSYLAGSMAYYYRNNMRSLTGEMSNNYGPNGIGYYMITRLLWKHDTDVRAEEDEFYRLAFGPAAEAVKSFYRRWESGQRLNSRTLGLALADLERAARLTADSPEHRARVDHLRMYGLFLKYYIQPQQFSDSERGRPAVERFVGEMHLRYGSEEAARHRVRELGEWVSRLMDTSMVHTFGFNRYWAVIGKQLGVEGADTWTRPGEIPSAEEVQTRFAAALDDSPADPLDDVPGVIFGRDLVTVATAPGVSMPRGVTEMSLSFSRPNTLVVAASPGQAVRLALPEDASPEVFFVSSEDFADGVGGLSRQRFGEAKFADGVLNIQPSQAGWLEIVVSRPPTSINQPCVFGQMAIGSGRLYFYVPRGTQRFLVQTGGHGGASFTVRDAAGNEVLAVTKDTAGEWVVQVPPGGDNAVWSFEGPQDPNANAGVRLIGVPNHLSPLPALLLVPRDSLAGAGQPR